MPISIKSPVVEARIRRLSEIMGLDASTVVDVAVQEKLRSLEPVATETKETRITSWLSHRRAHPLMTKPDRQAIEAEMFDADGLPK